MRRRVGPEVSATPLLRMIESPCAPRSSPSRRRPRAFSGKTLAAFCALFCFFLASFAFALPPQRLLLEKVTANAGSGVLTLNLSLTVDNEDGLRDMLKDGAVLELLASVVVERERSWWANAEVASRDFSSIIRHDPLSRDFLVTLPADEEPTELRDRNLTRLLHNSWRKLVLYVVPVQRLEEEEIGEEAVVNLTLSLHHTEVPPWLEKSLVFWSSEVVPKEKRTLKVPLPVK